MRRVSEVRTPRLQNYIAFRRDVLAFLQDMVGQGDVVSLRTGFAPSYVVNSPDFVQEILVGKESAFRKGRTTKILRWTLGHGLLTSEPPEHGQQRKMMMPVFYKERLQAYAAVMVEQTERLVLDLRKREHCNLQDEMMQLTLGIIAQTMFATDVEADKQQLAGAVGEIIEETARVLFRPFIVPLAVPTPGNRKLGRAIRLLEARVLQAIREATEAPDRYRSTLLGLLLDTREADGTPLQPQFIRNQLMTMLLAGHETTANLLVWLFYELDRHPDIAARLRAEVEGVDLSAAHAFEAYRQLSYTAQVIQEGLRLYPPAWLIYREAHESVSLLGESFGPGSTFMISPYALHRNPAIFPDPDRFDPERFANGQSADWPRFAYFPFGGGTRSCIGSRFAVMEATIILAILMKHVRFERVETAAAVPEPLVSLRVQNGLPVRIHAQ